MAVLPATASSGTIGAMEDEEATTLVLETLFDIRTMVSEVHAVVMTLVEDDDGEEEEEEDS